MPAQGHASPQPGSKAQPGRFVLAELDHSRGLGKFGEGGKEQGGGVSGWETVGGRWDCEWVGGKQEAGPETCSCARS